MSRKVVLVIGVGVLGVLGMFGFKAVYSRRFPNSINLLIGRLPFLPTEPESIDVEDRLPRGVVANPNYDSASEGPYQAAYSVYATVANWEPGGGRIMAQTLVGDNFTVVVPQGVTERLVLMFPFCIFDNDFPDSYPKPIGTASPLWQTALRPKDVIHVYLEDSKLEAGQEIVSPVTFLINRQCPS